MDCRSWENANVMVVSCIRSWPSSLSREDITALFPQDVSHLWEMKDTVFCLTHRGTLSPAFIHFPFISSAVSAFESSGVLSYFLIIKHLQFEPDNMGNIIKPCFKVLTLFADMSLGTFLLMFNLNTIVVGTEQPEINWGTYWNQNIESKIELQEGKLSGDRSSPPIMAGKFYWSSLNIMSRSSLLKSFQSMAMALTLE